MTAAYHGKPSLPYKHRMERHQGDAWLIWSNKWGCWYRPNSQGYTKDVTQAGIFTKEKARLHYTPPHLPKSHRDTEPFPLSAVMTQVTYAERRIDAEYIQQKSRILEIRKIMGERFE